MRVALHHRRDAQHLPARFIAIAAMRRISIKALHHMIHCHLKKRSHSPISAAFDLPQILGLPCERHFHKIRRESRQTLLIRRNKPLQRTRQLPVDIVQYARFLGPRSLIRRNDLCASASTSFASSAENTASGAAAYNGIAAAKRKVLRSTCIQFKTLSRIPYKIHLPNRRYTNRAGIVRHNEALARQR